MFRLPLTFKDQKKDEYMKIKASKTLYTSLPLFCSMGFFIASAAQAANPIEEMSSTVEQLCPQLAAINNNNPGVLTAAEKDVLFRCGELKRQPGQSFQDLSDAQREGLYNMTSDESSVMGTSSVDLSGMQNIAILGRLTLLRSKTASTVANNSPTPSEPNRSDHVAQQALSPNHQGAATTTEMMEEMQLNVNGYSGNFSQMSEYGNWGFFLTSSYGLGEKDPTDNEPGFDFDSWSIVSGADYRLSEQMVLGFAFSYAMTDSSVDYDRGDIEVDGIGGSVYGFYYTGDFYFDAIAGYSYGDYNTTRNLSYTVAAKAGGVTRVNQGFSGNTNSDDINISLGTGYNAKVASFFITPNAQLQYVRSEIDSYTESLQGSNTNAGFGLTLRVDDQEITSLNSTLGLMVNRPVNTSQGVFTPYLKADYIHEFDNDSREITAHFATVRSEFDELNTIVIPTDAPDRDYFDVGAGLSTVFPGGLQCFLDYNTVLGYDDLTVHRITAGLRFEF